MRDEPDLSYNGWYMSETGQLVHAPRSTADGTAFVSYCGRRLHRPRTQDHIDNRLKHRRCKKCRTIRKK